MALEPARGEVHAARSELMREMRPPLREPEPPGISMEQFCDGRPNLRYTFFGGMSGAGKTVMAGAMALRMAGRGRPVLLASANPVQGLSRLLDQDVLGRHTPVEGVKDLWAYEIDTSALETSAEFGAMVDLMLANEYETYVFDTVPTVDAHRLLGVSQELIDPARTAFFFVVLPDALPIEVARSFIDWFTEAGVPIGGVVVNGVLEAGAGGGTTELVRNRIVAEQGYLEEIRERFDGLVRAVIPLYDREIRGVPMLERAAAELFA